MAPIDVAVAVLVALGGFFSLVAAIGVVRLPDVYARIHAVSKSETLGAIFALTAVALVLGSDVGTIKSVFLLAFLFVTNPTAAHAVARAADDQGIEPWTAADGGASATEGDGASTAAGNDPSTEATGGDRS